MDLSNSSQQRLTLKNKLRNRKSVFAGWTSFGHPGITEILTRSGVDFIGIDLEHSTINQEQSQRIIAASHQGGVCCLPRIASHNKEMARRLLDSGADGLIVPMVNSADEAKAIVEWMKYPPVGKRGFGVARAQGYGFDFQNYTKEWNASSILIAQIETIDAVKRIDEILAVDELDAVMVGPYDISGSLNVPGQLDHPLVKDAALKVISACRQKGKGCGTQIIEPNKTNIKEALDFGYTMTVLASDVFILWKWAARVRDDIASL